MFRHLSPRLGSVRLWKLGKGASSKTSGQSGEVSLYFCSAHLQVHTCNFGVPDLNSNFGSNEWVASTPGPLITSVLRSCRRSCQIRSPLSLTLSCTYFGLSWLTRYESYQNQGVGDGNSVYSRGPAIIMFTRLSETTIGFILFRRNDYHLLRGLSPVSQR